MSLTNYELVGRIMSLGASSKGKSPVVKMEAKDEAVKLLNDHLDVLCNFIVNDGFKSIMTEFKPLIFWANKADLKDCKLEGLTALVQLKDYRKLKELIKSLAHPEDSFCKCQACKIWKEIK